MQQKVTFFVLRDFFRMLKQKQKTAESKDLLKKTNLESSGLEHATIIF